MRVTLRPSVRSRRNRRTAPTYVRRPVHSGSMICRALLPSSVRRHHNPLSLPPSRLTDGLTDVLGYISDVRADERGARLDLLPADGRRLCMESYRSVADVSISATQSATRRQDRRIKQHITVRSRSTTNDGISSSSSSSDSAIAAATVVSRFQMHTRQRSR